MLFFAPDTGGDGGGSIIDSLPGPESSEVTPTPDEGREPLEPAAKTDTSFDPKTFAQEFGRTIGETLSKQNAPKTEEKKYTPEELKKVLNVWEPTKEWQARYDNLETREAAFMEMRDGLMRQNDTVTQLRLSQQKDQFTQQLAPMQAFIKQQEAIAIQNRFEASYPQLKGPENSDLIAYAAHTLQKEGKTFSTEKEAHAAVAQRVVALRQSQDPNFKLSTGAPAPAKKSAGGIPVTSPGAGGGGSGGGGTEPTGKSRALSILGPVGAKG